jgi:hypothetical protein
MQEYEEYISKAYVLVVLMGLMLILFSKPKENQKKFGYKGGGARRNWGRVIIGALFLLGGAGWALQDNDPATFAQIQQEVTTLISEHANGDAIEKLKNKFAGSDTPEDAAAPVQPKIAKKKTGLVISDEASEDNAEPVAPQVHAAHTPPQAPQPSQHQAHNQQHPQHHHQAQRQKPHPQVAKAAVPSAPQADWKPVTAPKHKTVENKWVYVKQPGKSFAYIKVNGQKLIYSCLEAYGKTTFVLESSQSFGKEVAMKTMSGRAPASFRPVRDTYNPQVVNLSKSHLGAFHKGGVLRFKLADHRTEHAYAFPLEGAGKVTSRVAADCGENW